MNPPPLTADDFSAFFCELWGANCDPFPWQREFARRLCAGLVPDYVAVPTGSGKTACLDAAVFALAAQAALPMTERTQGRRLFFIVNRRVIVDEAYERAGDLCKKLSEAAPDSVAGRVAVALLGISGKSAATPLTRVQLRGGIYRDRSWAGSLLQPMIICSTVDQTGSRLLFRGYGVSPQARPIHAALVAQDSLLIIDEAHISRPFIQTLEWVKKYRRYQSAGGETVQLPFQLIQMTATPPAGTRDDQKITLSPADHEHPILQPRLRGAKPARLVIEPKAKGKAREGHMAARLVEEAKMILAAHQPRSIAIMVNRVATARSVEETLEKENRGRVVLLIGRLRPLDREVLTKDIQERLKTGVTTDTPEDGPIIVVSTQCLEVGADLDFDALVTEAASLDALRQRFGRLNRSGRAIAARAVIVLPADQDLPTDTLDEAAPCDPIYGNAIPRTWRWLNSLAQEGVVDFGINAMTAAVDSLRVTSTDEVLATMLSPTKDAPVLLPAYLDCWVQTNPAPAADPEVALFLHGPQRGMAEVQVCWRADLPDNADENAWIETLALCPPTTPECLPVPLHLMRQWLENGGKLAGTDTSGDVPQDIAEPEKNRLTPVQPPRVFIWRGTKSRRAAADEASQFIEKSRDVRPGDTLILRTQDGGWQILGYLPHAPADPLPASASVDCAERGQARMRRRVFVRLHPTVWSVGDKGTPTWQLSEWAKDPEFEWRTAEVSEMLRAAAETIGDADSDPVSLAARLRHLAKWTLRKRGQSGLEVESSPSYGGLVLSVRELLPASAETADDGASDDDADDPLLEAAEAQSLDAHTRRVTELAKSSAAALGLTAFADALIRSAELHDFGKADHRFQALLIGSDVAAALAQPILWAKSASIPTSALARRRARLRATLPDGFRHEMLSVHMAGSAIGASAVPKDEKLRALALHLIATHHGYARPFAPLVDDEAPPDVTCPNDKTITVTGAERLAHPAHVLDSGLAERFWQMNRHYGWWGIALLEAVLRLADQSASANSQATAKP
ncbi:MAG: type I-U CRISPR-associated helicase/endonuclease Cas3 [Verrucomicrobiales bacterium]|nr:type I-U CRISPR-associated helicase/endonuclease Cas3 [Verrucomicrobiales bacterium]